MVYDSTWYTNFPGDQPGAMEFRWDVAWSEKPPARPEDAAETLEAEPAVMIQPALREDPRMTERLWRP